MTLEYSTTRSTLWRWYWRSLFRNRAHRTVWLAWMLGAFLTGFLGAHSAGRSNPWSAVAGLAVSFCLAAFFAGYPQLKFKSQTRVLTLLPNELTTTIRGETKTYSWGDVATLEEDDGFLIIRLRNFNAFIVPPTAFRDGHERKELVEQCSAWRQAAARLGEASR